MKQITIEKKDEEITYRRIETTIDFLVNGKRLRIYIHENSDDQGSDYDIDENDKKNLTDEEYETFMDEDIWKLSRTKIGKVLKINSWDK